MTAAERFEHLCREYNRLAATDDTPRRAERMALIAEQILQLNAQAVEQGRECDQ